MPPSPLVSAPCSQVNEVGKPLGLNGMLGKERLTGRRTNATLAQSNSPGSVLYITRVTIGNQQFVLGRHRSGFVKHRFDQDRLAEARRQELVFDNPIHDKPTFLWFFDSTPIRQLETVTNRPSAKVAIIEFKMHGERKGATGIHLYNAPDRATAALVPSHEATRKTDFAERESFEVEIDYEDDDKDEDSEKASRIDFAYGPRDGELQLDDKVVAEEVDAKPIISVEGELQQQQRKQ